MSEPTWVYDDGGRSTSGFTGTTDAGDCVVRAIAIATGIEYRTVYDELAERYAATRNGKRSARDGLPRKVYEKYLFDLGWIWQPTMSIGSGCTVHLRRDELPDEGPIIVRLSRHVCAVVDGVIRDNHDPSRDGTRCVYGIYEPTAALDWD